MEQSFLSNKQPLLLVILGLIFQLGCNSPSPSQLSKLQADCASADSIHGLVIVFYNFDTPDMDSVLFVQTDSTGAELSTIRLHPNRTSQKQSEYTTTFSKAIDKSGVYILKIGSSSQYVISNLKSKAHVHAGLGDQTYVCELDSYNLDGIFTESFTVDIVNRH